MLIYLSLSTPRTLFMWSGTGVAGIAQPVEHKLPKLGVAGSKPVARSMNVT
jgi:hypothetical protein